MAYPPPDTVSVLAQARAINDGLLAKIQADYLTLGAGDKAAVRTAILDPGNAALYGDLTLGAGHLWLDAVLPP